jgi:DNA polymerase (family 10)
MLNAEIAQTFRDIAKILEIKQENVFRVRAYERAAQNIEALDEDVSGLARENRLSEIPGVGKDLSGKITEYCLTNKIKYFEQLKKEIPQGVLELLSVPSVGPKTVRLLFEKLKVKSVAGLEKAISKGRLNNVPGIKEKTIANILKGIAIFKRGKERITLAQATKIAGDFSESLSGMKEVDKLSSAGSLRRQKETVGDIDILIVSQKPAKVMHKFTRLPSVAQVLASGATKASVRTRQDVQVDCRVVEAKSFGAALVYFTGSKDFNIRLRQIAIKKGLKVNEYGVFRKNKFICGRTEEDVFKVLGLPYIEPELRENRGEIELAMQGRLPELVGLKDIKGDLHTHSDWSDGVSSIEEMAQAARERGYEYIALTDHSQSLKIANGLSVEDLKKKRAQIDRVNSRLKGITVLFGTEVDIDSQGRIDYKDDILKGFDIVVAAIHTGFKQPLAQLTKRLVSACRNKYVHVIAHPTGRLWGVRDAYPVDMNEVFKAAKDTNTHMEINSFPNRLDLNDINCRRASELGVKFAISTDSHESTQLDAIRFGLSVARRAGLTKNSVINTYGLNKLLKEIHK